MRSKATVASLMLHNLFVLVLLASALQINLEVERLAYLPCEKVEVEGLVTYNFEGLENQLVSVQLTTPNGTTLDSRSFVTDGNGEFTYTVRLPYNAQPGLWTVYAATMMGGDYNATAAIQFFVPVYDVTVENYHETVELSLWLQVLIASACASIVIASITTLKGRMKDAKERLA